MKSSWWKCISSMIITSLYIFNQLSITFKINLDLKYSEAQSHNKKQRYVRSLLWRPILIEKNNAKWGTNATWQHTRIQPFHIFSFKFLLWSHTYLDRVESYKLGWSWFWLFCIGSIRPKYLYALIFL